MILSKLRQAFIIAVFSLVIISPFGNLIPKAFAQTGPATAVTTALTIWGLVNSDNMNMREWIKGAFISSVVEIANEVIFGMNSDELALCEGNWGTGNCVLTVDDLTKNNETENKPNTKPTGSVVPRAGLLAFTAQTTRDISMAKPPLNLALYIDDVASQSIFFPAGTAQAGFVRDIFIGAHTIVDAVAQDVFEGVVLKLWKQSRNVAYFFFIVVMIVGGFMIMFNRQIEPRTAVTVQYLLPRVVLGLLGVTFSYAIVSFGVQMAHVLQFLGYALIENMVPDLLTGGSPLYAMLNVLLALFPPVTLFYVFITLVVLLAIIFTAFAFFFATISRFVKLVLLAVVGPLVIAWGSLPGQEEAITNWFKGVLSNVVAIPAMFTVFWLGWAILVTSTFAAPNPLSFFISLILGAGLMWQARKMPKVIDAALGAPEFYIPGRVKKK
ncbi:MAG: hypothetical protein ABH814_00985 [bacterium]